MQPQAWKFHRVSMEMNWKMVRLQGDRISALPPQVLCHILSFLPTFEAVRTSVLSKTWNNLWASLNSLDFDDGRDQVSDFVRFVTCVLMFHHSLQPIQKFKLKISHGLEGGDLENFDDWIGAAVRRNVVDFHLRMPYRVPKSVFTCKTLKALRLEMRDVPIPYDHDDYPAVCFPILKFLHVTVQHPDWEVPELLFSNCPVVEDMIIDGSANNDNYNFNIGAPELKSLLISLADPNNEYENSFAVDAPKLEKLVLESVFLSNYNLANVRSLISAIISFDAISASEFEYFPARATALLAGVSNVQYLSLSTHSFEVSYLPAFNNLKKLDLLLHKCNYWEFLAELLKKAPNLDDLVLEDKTVCDNEYSELAWNPPEVVPVGLLSYLRTITIKGFKGLNVEMELATYLLNNGHVLNKLTLYTWLSYTEAKEMYKELMIFRKAMRNSGGITETSPATKLIIKLLRDTEPL